MSDKNKTNHASSFLKGATILTIAGIVSRLLGLFYKIPLYRLVGSYGNGIYGNVTYIYNTLLMISTVGIPVAISKMVSENIALDDYRGVRDVFRISLASLCVLGGISTLFLFIGADWLISVSGWPAESYAAIMAIALAPFIISVCSAFRGYFQGFQLMRPTAISQIIEQIIRVGLGMFLAWFCVYNGYGIGAAVGGAILGATVGGVAAVVFLLAGYYIFKERHDDIRLLSAQQRPRKTKKQIFKRLLMISIPITLTASLSSLFATADSMMYIGQLAKAGFSEKVATIMFGDYTNVDTLISIPMVIASNLAVALIPAIAESFALKDRKALQEKIEIAIRIVSIIALPCCVGFFVLRNGIFDLLFPGSEYGPSLLSIFCLSTFFLMLSTIFQNILQSIDKMRIPMFNLIIGTIIRLVSCYILMGIPGINIYGIGISSTVTFAFLMFANYYFVKRFSGVRIRWMKTIIIPLIASLVMGGICWLVYWPINAVIGNKIAVALAVIAAVVVYVLFLFVFRIVSEDELLSIPGGKLLIPLYRKLSPSGRKRRKK